MLTTCRYLVVSETGNVEEIKTVELTKAPEHPSDLPTLDSPDLPGVYFVPQVLYVDPFNDKGGAFNVLCQRRTNTATSPMADQCQSQKYLEPESWPTLTSELAKARPQNTSSGNLSGPSVAEPEPDEPSHFDFSPEVRGFKRAKSSPEVRDCTFSEGNPRLKRSKHTWNLAALDEACPNVSSTSLGSNETSSDDMECSTEANFEGIFF